MIKWVARLAFLTVLLALIGTFVIITSIREKHDGNELKQDDQLQKQLTK
jgi:putative Mn2+ efflux pump MntP